MKDVSISVVIPAFNSERLIRHAIRSAINQTVVADEILVIDNNSTDNTKKISEDLGVRVVRESEQGISAARNKGIESSSCDWIAFLDSDDKWHPKKLEYQINAIRKFPEAGIVSCDSGWILGKQEKTYPSPKTMGVVPLDVSGTVIDGDYSFTSQFTADLSEWFQIDSSTMCFCRSVFDQVGLFDKKFLFAQDIEFMYRALAKFPIATVKKNLAYLRIHDGNRTNDRQKFTQFKMLVAKEMKKFPEKYPPGIVEYFIDYEKRMFLENGRRLAAIKKQSGSSQGK